jgi:hypothetical protein
MAFQRFRYYQQHVPVCGVTLTMAEDEETGVYWFPVRPVCLALGVDSPSQMRTIRASRRFGPALHAIPLPAQKAPDGRWTQVHETQCLPWIEFAWWLGSVEPRNAPETVIAKLLQRQRALMEMAAELDRMSDAQVEQARRAVLDVRRGIGATEGLGSAGARPQVVATGEIHMHCPVCATPLCIVINGAHVVPGVEAE